MDRDAFLARLRDRLRTPAPPNLAHPLPVPGETLGSAPGKPLESARGEPVEPPPPAGQGRNQPSLSAPDRAPIPPVRYPRDLTDPVAAFEDSARARGCRVERIRSDDDLRALLAELRGAHAVRTAVLSRDPETAAIAPLLAEAGIAIVPFDGPASAATADLGITGAAWGIAATGTLAVDAGRAGGRSASLVVPVHLALVAADRIVATPSDVWRRMGERFPDGPPSQLVFITGPSRSADIEFTLTVGVHGPKAVWVGILGGPS